MYISLALLKHSLMLFFHILSDEFPRLVCRQKRDKSEGKKKIQEYGNTITDLTCKEDQNRWQNKEKHCLYCKNAQCRKESFYGKQGCISVYIFQRKIRAGNKRVNIQLHPSPENLAQCEESLDDRRNTAHADIPVITDIENENNSHQNGKKACSK